MKHEQERVEELERTRMTARDVSWALRSLNRAAAEVDESLSRRMGLRPLDYAAMGHVMSQEGTSLGPAELGHRLGISTGSATELVDRLERAGHISRARDSTDRRRVALVPQERTVARVLGELGPLFDALDELADGYTEAEQALIERYLRDAAVRMSDYARGLSGDGGATGEPGGVGAG